MSDFLAKPSMLYSSSEVRVLTSESTICASTFLVLMPPASAPRPPNLPPSRPPAIAPAALPPEFWFWPAMSATSNQSAVLIWPPTTFDPFCRLPPPASACSFWIAAMPAPRLTSLKQPDLDTNVFSSVEGAPSWYSFQPWPSPSTSAMVPSTLPHCGISALLVEPFSFSTLAEAATEVPSARTAAQAAKRRDTFISQSPDW